jgi:hypothetical protein
MFRPLPFLLTLGLQAKPSKGHCEELETPGTRMHIAPTIGYAAQKAPHTLLAAFDVPGNDGPSGRVAGPVHHLWPQQAALWSWLTFQLHCDRERPSLELFPDCKCPSYTLRAARTFVFVLVRFERTSVYLAVSRGQRRMTAKHARPYYGAPFNGSNTLP